MTFNKTIKNECENYMTKSNAKKSNIETKIEQIVETSKNEILRVANVARELNINEKRARAFLRKNENVDQYNEFRNKQFTRESSLYKKCHALLTSYKNKNVVVTK